MSKKAPAKQAKAETIRVNGKAATTKQAKAVKTTITKIAKAKPENTKKSVAKVVKAKPAKSLGKDIKTLAKAATKPIVAIANTPVKFSTVGDTQPFKLGGVIHIKLGNQALALPSVQAKRNGSFAASREDLAKGKIVKLRAAELVTLSLK